MRKIVVRMNLSPAVFSVRIGWALIEEVPFVLGRLDVFEIFDIEFKQSSRTAVFRTAVLS